MFTDIFTTLFGSVSAAGEACRISDGDVPGGCGGINREGYTYGELRRRPIIPEVMRGVSNPVMR